MDVFHEFNRGWKDTDGLIFCLRSYKRKMNKRCLDNGSIDRNYIIESLRTLFLMLPYSRDLYLGKGERDLSYRMIYAWYQVFPILAIKALHMLFDKMGGDGYMIGSWCDVKYFCLFIEKISVYGLYDPLISIMIRIANRQLKRDLGSLESNVSKWIVRESKHPELFSLFVHDWFRKGGYVENKKKIYRQIISWLSARFHKYEFIPLNRDLNEDLNEDLNKESDTIDNYGREPSYELQDEVRGSDQLLCGSSMRKSVNLRWYKVKFSAIVKKRLLNNNFVIQRNAQMPSIDIGLYVRFVVEGVILHQSSPFRERGEREERGNEVLGAEVQKGILGVSSIQKDVKDVKQDYMEELISWIDHEWKKLMKTFPMGSYDGIAIVNLDLTIGSEALYNSLGFACLIAMKMKTNRILLAGSIPICIDISECNGLCSMVKLLWSYCENRGKSSMTQMGVVIKEAIRLVSPLNVLRIFVFSDKLKSGLGELGELGELGVLILNEKKCDIFFDHVDIIFWDMGSLAFGDMASDGLGDGVIDNDVIYMSGYNSGLIRPFLEENLKEISDNKKKKDKVCFLSGVLKRQYSNWNDFFDEFMNKMNE